MMMQSKHFREIYPRWAETCVQMQGLMSAVHPLTSNGEYVQSARSSRSITTPHKSAWGEHPSLTISPLSDTKPSIDIQGGQDLEAGPISMF